MNWTWYFLHELSPKIDRPELSEKAIDNELISGIKYVPHECPACGQPASISPAESSFCRNEDCILRGWRF